VPAQAAGGEAPRPPPCAAGAPALPLWAPVRIQIGRREGVHEQGDAALGDEKQGGAAGVGVGGWED
jgi:hypothetical protein